MTISIFKFLSRYYGIFLNAATECTHLDIKKNFDFVESCPLSYAKDHIDMVSSGEIIYVEDTNGVIRTYFCPEEIIEIECECSYEKENLQNDDLDLTIMENIKAIPTYKLCELLSRFRKRRGLYRIIKKELISRGVYSNKIYKKNKEIAYLEESEKDDKYKRRQRIKCKKP